MKIRSFSSETIIIIIITLFGYFSQAFAGGLSLEPEPQQFCLGIQDAS